MGFADHGHGGASDDAAAAAVDMMEQGCVRLRPQPVLGGAFTGERAAEERRRPKKFSPSSGHSRRPTMAFFTGLLIGLLLVYFVTATSLPMSNAMKISFLFVASAPLVVILVTNVLLQRAD